MSEKLKSESRPRPAPLRQRVRKKGRCISLARHFPVLLSSVTLLLFLLPFPSFAQISSRAIDPGEILTLSQAIEIALKAQPAILGARYTVRANEARVGEALSNYYPQLSTFASYSRYSSITTASLAGVPISGGAPAVGTGASAAAVPSVIPTSTGAYNQYTASLGLTQVVYDFGKTSTQVRINKLNTDAARFDLANTQQTVVLNVKQAYYDVLQAQLNAEVSRQSVKQYQQHLEQAQAFFDAGTRARFDVTKSEVDLSNARVSLIAAENQIKLALVTLNNAIGIPNAPDYRLENSLLYEPFELPFEDALEQAYARRPDLLAQIKRRESSRQSIGLARKGYFPVLTANGNYDYSGSDFPLQNGWSYGLNLSVPIFNGLLTRYQISEAQANFGTVSASEQSLRLDIYSQVQQGYVSLRDAAERIKASELAVRQAKENVDLANGRYAEGVGGPLEVTDAIVAQSNAELTHTAALTDYKNAQAAIEKAIGGTR